jgi:hypothetical protein
LNDPRVVEEFVKICRPVKVFVSEKSVVEAVESVPVIVTGEEPMIVKPEHETEPEQAADVVAIVETSPVEPTYVRPCESEVSRSADENVELAVENNPPPKPMAVEVELYPTFTVNGKAYDVNPASLVNQESFTVDDAIVFTVPFVPRYAKPCASDGRLNDPVNLFAPLNVLLSPRRVDDANVHVDVEKLYTCPVPFTARAPLESKLKLSVPMFATVADA